MSAPRLAPRCNGTRTAGKLTMYEDFSDASTTLDTEEVPRSVSRVAHEMGALQAALQAVERRGSREHARLLGRTYLGRLDPQTVEEHVIEAAIQRILGQSVGDFEVTPDRASWETYVAETIALAWHAWASNDNDRAITLVRELRASQKRKESFVGQTGAIHLLTLYFWSQAVHLLAVHDRPGARRFFKRAIEMGSQFGTDSHPMISWAYAASFFEP